MTAQPRPLAVERTSNPGSAPPAVLDQSWRKDAACRDQVTRNFDPFDIPYTMENAPEEALAFCNTCPVARECLEEALWIGAYGVRAGTTQKQRDALLRYRLRKSCPVCGQRLPIPIDSERGVFIQVCSHCARSWRTERRSKKEIDREDRSDAE